MKKRTQKYWKNKIDPVFHEYIRRRDANNKTGYCKCITCNTQIHFTQSDAGHFISRAKLATRYDESNVYAQCRKCNRFEYGRQFEYSISLGLELSQDLLQKSRQIIKHNDNDWQAILDEYKQKLESIKKKQNF